RALGRGRRDRRLPAPVAAASVAFDGQDVGEVVLDGLFELFVRARAWVAVGSPAVELGGVSETDAFHVFVAHLDHTLGAQRRERQVLANRPTAVFGVARSPRAFFLFSPRPGVVVERGD